MAAVFNRNFVTLVFQTSVKDQLQGDTNADTIINTDAQTEVEIIPNTFLSWTWQLNCKSKCWHFCDYCSKSLKFTSPSKHSHLSIINEHVCNFNSLYTITIGES